MTFERRSPGLDRIVPADARVDLVACGFGFTEGPLWTGDGLLFSDIANSRIVQWRPLAEGPELTTYRCPSELANGLTYDRQRRLLACEGGSRRLTRTEADGRVVAVAESLEGQRLNSPNDVVVKRDGAIYFSDPRWGHRFANPFGPNVLERDLLLPFAGVIRLVGDRLEALARDFEMPNGLAFSPDERTLYVDDSRRGHIRAFDVAPDGTLTDDRVFADLRADEPGVPDGMKVDSEGNVYCTGPGGTWVVAPSGEILGRIVTPEVPANCAWGDADLRTLYITARTSVYRVRLRVPGVPVT